MGSRASISPRIFAKCLAISLCGVGEKHRIRSDPLLQLSCSCDMRSRSNVAGTSRTSFDIVILLLAYQLHRTNRTKNHICNLALTISHARRTHSYLYTVAPPDPPLSIPYHAVEKVIPGRTIALPDYIYSSIFGRSESRAAFSSAGTCSGITEDDHLIWTRASLPLTFWCGGKERQSQSCIAILCSQQLLRCVTSSARKPWLT